MLRRNPLDSAGRAGTFIGTSRRTRLKSSTKTSKAPPKTARRRGLDRPQVIEAARELADHVGASSLSVTQLAEKLGISPPSVYAHFDGLAEIRRELALRGYRELASHMTASGFGLAGEEALDAVCTAYLEWIRKSPGLYSAIIACPWTQHEDLQEASERWLAVLYRALAFYGFDREEAIHASRGLRSIVHGFASLERTSFRAPVDRDTSFQRMLRSFIQGLRDTAAAGKHAPDKASAASRKREARRAA
jgi:AcrR family transcriptional regulator